ncbi:MAG TPA: double-strand break repair protein AddB [Rhizomicrobium sp.]|jgi:ATP-dependent helicase/nuclease subunit B
MPPNIFTIPASAPFAETLARGLIVRTGADRDPLALSSITLFLPTRRAARALNEVFARMLYGAALLPNIRPLGDVDEDELLFDTGAEPLTIPPAISPLRRRLLLAALVQRWEHKARRGHLTFVQAASLADGLAKLLDEAETQEVDLTKLDKLVPKQFAAHWSEVHKFLKLVRDEWPKLLDAEGALNPAARRNFALRELAARLRDHPPHGLIAAAGSTGSIPATAELIGTIARLPNGLVVLPGLDGELDEASWNDLEPGHPQFGMKELLRRIEMPRHAVSMFDSPPQNGGRETLLRETLRPAPTTDAWRAIAERGSGNIADGLQGLSLIEAAHPGEEAAAVALLFRECLEREDNGRSRTAALVTPDRGLARRVAAEMRRWDVEVDDSAGQKVSLTAPGTFLCLLAEAAATQFAPVPLLALLKHPFASGRQATADFRRRVRQLDRFVLRGPRPEPGLDGLRAAIAVALAAATKSAREYEKAPLSELAYWFGPLGEMLQPLAAVYQGSTASIVDMLDIHLVAAETLATTDSISGDRKLWQRQHGEAVANFCAELRQAAAGLPKIETSSYPLLLRKGLDERVIRPPYGRHPRLAILGPLEARLQSFDVVVLGGLNEGAWPQAPDADPWLSRPMRAQLGLESPERRIGQSAHDFAMLAAQPRVVLTRSQKVDGTPTVRSRWLQRLLQLTRGLGLEERLQPEQPYAQFAAMRDDPSVPPKRMPPPRPCPPIAARPRRLSVTEIETWLRDPFAIYAKHVLRLQPLDPLDAEIGALERGSAIHSALELFLKEIGTDLQDDASLKLIRISDEVFREANLPKGVLALWKPRFLRAANWFVTLERKRRPEIKKSLLEIAGETAFPGPGGEFKLRARADRIDILNDGTAALVDYKTGSLPTPKQVKSLLLPQLPLEGAILAHGGFAEAGPLVPSQLIYIRFGGGAEPGELRPLDDVAALVAKAEQQLIRRIADFDEQEMPYLSRVRPYRADSAGDYDHLARVREWSLIGWEEAEE